MMPKPARQVSTNYIQRNPSPQLLAMSTTNHPIRSRRPRGRFTAIAGFMACLLWAAWPSYSHGQSTACNEATLNKVQQAYQSIRSFSGRFEQEDTRTNGKPLRAEGEIAYRRPGRMRWSYAPPNEQLLVTDGDTVWLYDPLLDNVTVQPLGELTRGTPLAFLLGVGNLARDFACRPHSRAPPSDGLRYLELTPRNPIPTLAFIQLGYVPESHRIAVLIMVGAQGNIRRVRLSQLKLNLDLPDKLFTFEISADMEVIEN